MTPPRSIFSIGRGFKRRMRLPRLRRAVEKKAMPKTLLRIYAGDAMLVGLSNVGLAQMSLNCAMCQREKLTCSMIPTNRIISEKS
jgi:hypothetical protein